MKQIFSFYNQDTVNSTIRYVLTDMDVILLIGIILVSGFIGGSANYYRSLKNGEDRNYFLTRSLITGLVASACVPLFLNMVSSSLLKLENRIPDLFVFAGFCLIASYFSFSFLRSLSDRTLGELDQKTEELDKKTAELQEELKKKDELLEATLKEIEKSKKGQNEKNEKKQIPKRILETHDDSIKLPIQDISSVLGLLPSQDNIFSADRFSQLLSLDEKQSTNILNRLEASNALAKFEVGSSKFYKVNSDHISS